MGFRRPIYAKGRLKAAWVLYRTVAWALPADDVCGNDGEWYEVFHVFVGEAHATTFRLVEWEASGGFDCFGPLPNPLPRGEGVNGRESKQWSDFTFSPWEREQIAGNHNNS